MTPFPIPAGSTPGDLINSFFQDHGSMNVRITDDGGGHFAVLKTEGDGVGLGPKELAALAEWCVAACAEMDAVVKP